MRDLIIVIVNFIDHWIDVTTRDKRPEDIYTYSYPNHQDCSFWINTLYLIRTKSSIFHCEFFVHKKYTCCRWFYRTLFDNFIVSYLLSLFNLSYTHEHNNQNSLQYYMYWHMYNPNTQLCYIHIQLYNYISMFIFKYFHSYII